MENISKQSRLDIVKGQVTDYAISVARCNDIDLKELVIILKQIADIIEEK